MKADEKMNIVPLKSPIKLTQDMQKKNYLFFKFPRFWGHHKRTYFLKNGHIRHEMKSMFIQYMLIALQN